MPMRLAIFRQERPCARNSAIWRRSTSFVGRPSVLPFARAFRRPALTRSTISKRPSSATAAGGGGGETHVHFNVSAMDARGVQDFFDKHRG